MDRIRTLVVDDEKPARRRLARTAGPRAGDRDRRRGPRRPGGRRPGPGARARPDVPRHPDAGSGRVRRTPGARAGAAAGHRLRHRLRRYAIQAFEAHAIDYLLKPYSDQRFEGALRRACQFLRSRGADEVNRRVGMLLEERGGSEPQAGYLERLVLKSGGRVTFVGVEDVDWIEASGVYVSLHVGSRAHLYRSSLAHLLQRLDPQALRPRPPLGGGQHRTHPRAAAAQPRRLHGHPQEQHRAGDEPGLPAAVRALAQAATLKLSWLVTTAQ